MDKLKVLYVEDDPNQAAVMSAWLSSTYDVTHFEKGEDFFEGEQAFTPDMVIFDWELPGMSGLELVKVYRERFGFDQPVMFVTQKDEESSIVSALSAGADDYMIKPVREFELKARLTALSRRLVPQTEANIEIGNIVLHVESEQATIDGESVEMTHKEFHVAKMLFQNKNKIVSRDDLLKEVWKTDAQVNTRTVDVHVSKIRKLFNIQPEMGFRIKTIYNHGYRFEEVEVE